MIVTVILLIIEVRLVIVPALAYVSEVMVREVWSDGIYPMLLVSYTYTST